jgi:hypothetical protein
VNAEVVAVGDDRVDLPAALAELARRGASCCANVARRCSVACSPRICSTSSA